MDEALGKPCAYCGKAVTSVKSRADQPPNVQSFSRHVWPQEVHLKNETYSVPSDPKVTVQHSASLFMHLGQATFTVGRVFNLNFLSKTTISEGRTIGVYNLYRFTHEESAYPHLGHKRIIMAWILLVKTKRVPQLGQNSTQITPIAVRKIDLNSYRVNQLMHFARFAFSVFSLFTALV